MAKVYLGLGSNIDPERNLRIAIDELRARFGSLESSSVYRSKAVGFDGADFLNLVVGIETDASPEAIGAEIEAIHELVGRRRGKAKFSSRPLDIDLLLYDDLVRETPEPRVPRPDILEYSFVLAPLAEIAPTLVHPVTGKCIEAHWREFERSTQPLTRVEHILQKA